MKPKFFILYSLFFILLLGVAFPARAAVGLSISPQKFELVVFPGDTYEGQFRLGNRSEIPLAISLRVVPFGAEEGTGEMRFGEIEPEGPQKWITFETPELILEPAEVRRLNFKVMVPEDTPAGGYYLFVYFEPRFPSYYFEQTGPKVVPIVGVPFLISTTPLLLEPEEDKKFEVLSFSIPEEERIKSLERFLSIVSHLISRSLATIGIAHAAQELEIVISQKTPSSFAVRIKNNDIYHLRPFGNLSIYNIFGSKIGQAELQGQTILPGKSRDFQIVINEQNTGFKFQVSGFKFLGSYRAELDLRALSPVRGELLPSGGNPSLAFFSLISFYFLITFILLLAVLFLVRKRIKLALWAFVKRET